LELVLATDLCAVWKGAFESPDLFSDIVVLLLLRRTIQIVLRDRRDGGSELSGPGSSVGANPQLEGTGIGSGSKRAGTGGRALNLGSGLAITH